jgi:phage-related tail fiber protein
MSDYRLVITNVGLTKLANANINGVQLHLTQFSVGDGIIVPSLNTSALVSEKYRANLNAVEIDNGVAIIDCVLPTEVGGWYIREAGLWDGDGDLFAVCIVPTTYKVSPSEGAAKSLQIRLRIAIQNAGSIAFETDETIIYATKDWTLDKLAQKVNLTGDETIAGIKTFSSEPVIPSKNTAAGNNATKPATEAQVYKVTTDTVTIADPTASATTLLSGTFTALITRLIANVKSLFTSDAQNVKLTGNQTVAGIKTFSSEPVIPSKNTAAGNNATKPATEAQVYKVTTDTVTIADPTASATTLLSGTFTALITRLIANVKSLFTSDAQNVKLTGNQTVAGIKTFSSEPVIPSKNTAADNNATKPATEAQVYKVTTDEIEIADPTASVTTLLSGNFTALITRLIANVKSLFTSDAQNVKLTGNQTVAGVKTFSSLPVVPAQSVVDDYKGTARAATTAPASQYQIDWRQPLLFRALGANNANWKQIAKITGINSGVWLEIGANSNSQMQGYAESVYIGIRGTGTYDFTVHCDADWNLTFIAVPDTTNNTLILYTNRTYFGVRPIARYGNAIDLTYLDTGSTTQPEGYIAPQKLFIRPDAATQIIAGAGLTGGGDLRANRTISMGTPGDITATSVNGFNGTIHTHKFNIVFPPTAFVAGDNFIRHSPSGNTPAGTSGALTFRKSFIALTSGTIRCILGFSIGGSTSLDYALRIYKNNALLAAGTGNHNSGSFQTDIAVAAKDLIGFEIYYQNILSSGITLTLNIDLGVTDTKQLAYFMPA